MIRERILFRLFFSLLLLLSFSPFCTYEPTFQIHPKVATAKFENSDGYTGYVAVMTLTATSSAAKVEL